MQTFIILWLGQTVSIIGSSMTAFAFTIWVWELTHQATALALFGFFIQVPQVLIAPIAGVIVDRWNRKLLMMFGDTVSGLLTIIISVLYTTNNLHLWHLYLAVAIKGIFEQFQELAYSASISTMLPKQHYSRASSITFLASSGSSIIAPAIAGFLYTIIGLAGILTIDIITCAIAVITVLRVNIPQPIVTEAIIKNRSNSSNIRQDISFGFHYIAARPSLFAMLALFALFGFAHDIGDSLYSAMILARTNNNPTILGYIASAAGIGGIVGALLMSSWGGFKHRIQGVLLGIIGTGLSKIVFGLGQTLFILTSAQFCSSLNYPMIGSSNDAIWLSKVRPDLQGRVFATRSMVLFLTSAIATLIAGLLADYIFEPAMMPGGTLSPIFGSIFGTKKGAGMALMYVISSLSLVIIGLSGYAFRSLRDLETILPDHDADNSQYLK
jgi:MFS transporter, DHA3 family, macrolide efflux protein